MSITTFNGFVTKGTTIADVIQDNNNNDTSWYAIWDYERQEFYQEDAKSKYGAWVSADSLTSMDISYDKNDFSIKSWGFKNKSSEWVDFTVSIGKVESKFELIDSNLEANTSITYDKIIDASQINSSAWITIYNGNKKSYVDSKNDCWIRADELDDYSFITGDEGSSNNIWVNTWLPKNGYSGWVYNNYNFIDSDENINENQSRYEKDIDSYEKSEYDSNSVDPWNFNTNNCTSYVAWKINKSTDINFTNNLNDGHFGNANNWDDNAKDINWTVNDKPEASSIAQWNGSKENPYGHVAYVESFDTDNNTILISEYNCKSEYNDFVSGSYGEREIPISSVDNFIHIPNNTLALMGICEYILQQELNFL